MKALQIITGLLAVFIVAPVAMYLQYRVLQGVNATNVMWLLYWTNVPLLILMQVIEKITKTIDG